MQNLCRQAGIHELTGLSYPEFTHDQERAHAQAGQSSAQGIIDRGSRPLLPGQAKIRARLDAEWGAGRMTSQPRNSTSRSNVMRMNPDRRRSA